MTLQGLFGADVPDGFRYREAVLDPAEETALLETIATLPFAAFVMRGMAARRRLVMFGAADEDAPAPVPTWLHPLRQRIAEWTQAATEDYSMALVLEYPPGAPIGWHRDAPQYGRVAGVSLLSPCTMKFRPYLRPDAPAPARRTATHAVTLQRRAAYLLDGPARTAYEHHIPPVDALRYSITFRTRRPGRAGAAHRGTGRAT